MLRVLTALQPSGFLHIGNYFGAIEPSIKLQEQNENFLFIVDYHAITVPQDPEQLKKNILFATATYLAAGIDPDKTTLFQQSRVPAHTELAWILNCFTHMGELERMTQYKDKARGKNESASVGLFDYPVLMAADILLYDTEVVPVGDDQKQHVELTRDIAERFNNKFGETFVVPDVQIRKFGARIMGLDDASNKMSKSATSAKSYISLMDEPDVIRKKVMSAQTDSIGTIAFDKDRIEIANLMTIYSLATKKDFNEIEKDFDGRGYGDFKKDLAEALVEYLKPLQEKINTYLADETQLKSVLDKGAEKANAIAEEKMKQVRGRLGIVL